ncbi:MAG: DUF1456 family protein, partial [Bacteroidetes bacterium]|nr:DUF1456 family protein [Bacteroidota bacterium]
MGISNGIEVFDRKSIIISYHRPMNNNDILRRIRYIFDFNDEK